MQLEKLVRWNVKIGQMFGRAKSVRTSAELAGKLCSISLREKCRHFCDTENYYYYASKVCSLFVRSLAKQETKGLIIGIVFEECLKSNL